MYPGSTEFGTHECTSHEENIHCIDPKTYIMYYMYGSVTSLEIEKVASSRAYSNATLNMCQWYGISN